MGCLLIDETGTSVGFSAMDQTPTAPDRSGRAHFPAAWVRLWVLTVRELGTGQAVIGTGRLKRGICAGPGAAVAVTTRLSR
jgi:hypothetical protein